MFSSYNLFINSSLVSFPLSGCVSTKNSEAGFILGLNNYVRFISVVDGHYTFKSIDERSVFVDPPSEINNSISYERLFMFHLMNNSIPGIPMIYYGDEFGLPGAGGADSMRKMKFQKDLTIIESYLKDRVSKLNSLRSKHSSLALGDFIILRESENFTVWLKSYFNEKIIIVMNLLNKEINLNVPIPFETHRLTSLLSDQVIKLDDYNMARLVIPPYKADIFLLDTKINNY